MLRGVSFRIDRHHHHLQAFGVLAEGIADLHHVEHGRRAKVGTIGVAEIDEHHVAALGIEGKRYAVLGGQGQIGCPIA
ncbi:MAG: hypothetical protein M3490_11315 [Chloroflexota bacterium]|nr:hypothetical protein [Chloroflexota bacterium]